MSSETDFAEFSTLFQSMIQDGIGEGLARFLPVIFDLAEEVDDDDEEESTYVTTSEMVTDPVSRRFVVIRSSGSGFEDLFNGEKRGRLPASKSSVESMPRVVIGEDKENGGSCPICLDEWSKGDVAAEMPCKHKFHSKCVEEWLGKHATCPLCRYEMPVEEKEEEEEEEEGDRVGVWIGFSISGVERRNSEDGGR
ncbi:hypothetical protein AALP_AA1G156600 [Arabis alpina]|uniref:RING-type E3 ubiquitin transferase n=1 Tax=Arabis alpina TaxID=50452 RepID=A0A087HNF9_ARAAL|nr:hypothetical protein AALP_AA1G156600 [Arabis alpina]